MKRAIIICVLMLSGCVPKPIPEPVVVLVVPPPPKAATPAAVPSDPVAAVSVLPPKQLVRAADKSLSDADGYVAWKMSRADNIDALTGLTARVSATIAAMKAGEVGGHYRPADVAAARSALHALRLFLRNKGD